MPRMPIGRWTLLFTLATIAVVMAACGGRPSSPSIAAPEPIVWPPPPAQARIRYVTSISGPQDAGIKRSFFARVGDRLFGQHEEYLIRPTGVAAHDDVLYVADPGAQALWIFDPLNSRSVKVDRLVGAMLDSPVAVAATDDGEVFLADSALVRVFRLDRNGRLLGTIADEMLRRPAGIAWDDKSRRLYVADSGADRIFVFGADGSRIGAWGERGNADGAFNRPTHVAVTSSGIVLVTDAMNFRVQAFDPSGRFLWKMGHHGDGSGDLAAPKGVAVDTLGHLYVVDALFDAVQIFEKDGTFLLNFGGRGVAPGQFWLPGGIVIDRQDRIYVADSFNQRVQVFRFLRTPEEEGRP